MDDSSTGEIRTRKHLFLKQVAHLWRTVPLSRCSQNRTAFSCSSDMRYNHISQAPKGREGGIAPAVS